MNRRDFLGSASASVLAASTLVLASSTPANAFVITLAAVAKVATIAASALSMFSSSSSSAAGLAYQSYQAILEVHQKLDQLEMLILETLERVSALPAQVRKEIEEGNERRLNRELISIVNAFAEDLKVFESALDGDDEAGAYSLLKDKTLLHQAKLQGLRNELRFYSGFSLIALAGSAITEVAMHVILGGKPEQLGHLRTFYSDLLEFHKKGDQANSLAALIATEGSRYLKEQANVATHLAEFPIKAGSTATLADGNYYLNRCISFGYPARVWGKAGAASSEISPGHTALNLNNLFSIHENESKKKKHLDHDRKNFVPTGTMNSRVQIFVDTFEAGEKNLNWLRVPARPEVVFTAGGNDASGSACSTKVIGRPNVNERKYVEHVKSAHDSAEKHNRLAEAYGVLLQYQTEVSKAYNELDRYFGEIGVPS
ncbi:hypothetical protein [Aliiroseovarius sp. 2305UL8-7]|uniref:hypothetical protein n=1 Tax=Aliiroseovarius conchicola TaxID=3121637 RepID=UPI003528626D